MSNMKTMLAWLPKQWTIKQEDHNNRREKGSSRLVKEGVSKLATADRRAQRLRLEYPCVSSHRLTKAPILTPASVSIIFSCHSSRAVVSTRLF